MLTNCCEFSAQPPPQHHPSLAPAPSTPDFHTADLREARPPELAPVAWTQRSGRNGGRFWHGTGAFSGLSSAGTPVRCHPTTMILRCRSLCRSGPHQSGRAGTLLLCACWVCATYWSVWCGRWDYPLMCALVRAEQRQRRLIAVSHLPLLFVALCL